MSLWLGCRSWSWRLSILVRPWSLLCTGFFEVQNLMHATWFFLHRLRIVWRTFFRAHIHRSSLKFCCFILPNGERQNICQSFFPLTDSISLIELCFFPVVLLQLEVLAVFYLLLTSVAHMFLSWLCGCVHLEFFFRVCECVCVFGECVRKVL